MKKCELCDSVANMYCESDQASLCWDCDIKVHGANFLVAKHSRTLLCHLCQSPTPWNASGPKLGPKTVSVCENCVNSSSKESRNEEEDEERDDDEDGEGEEEEEEEEEHSIGEDGGGSGENGADENDGGNAADDEDNQVVPWSSSPSTPPPDSNSLSDEECCYESFSRSTSSYDSYPCKRRRYNAYQVRNFFI